MRVPPSRWSRSTARSSSPASPGPAYIPFVSEMPHGGFGASGYGKDLSGYGFEGYTRIST
jgi:hypothetical protein